MILTSFAFLGTELEPVESFVNQHATALLNITEIKVVDGEYVAAEAQRLVVSAQQTESESAYCKTHSL
jgi:hypothetical protein